MVKVQQIATGKVLSVAPSLARVLLKLGKHVRYDDPEIAVAAVKAGELSANAAREAVGLPPVPVTVIEATGTATATSDEPVPAPETIEPAPSAVPAEKPKRQYRRRDMSADKAEG